MRLFRSRRSSQESQPHQTTVPINDHDNDIYLLSQQSDDPKEYHTVHALPAVVLDGSSPSPESKKCEYYSGQLNSPICFALAL